MWLKRINSKKFTLCVILSAWSVKIYDLIQCLLVTISFHLLRDLGEMEIDRK